MRAHKSISKIILASNMRPINVTLDATTWELAKKKPNFSSWVRDQLRSERNKKGADKIFCRYCNHLWPKNAFYDHICVPGWKEGEQE